MNMTRKVTPIILMMLLSFAASAQFPGGGGGFGGNRGGGNDRPQRQTVIPGTAEDTPKGNGKIKGILIDSVSKKPVEFAALSLVDIKTNNPIDGTTTDEKGAFELTKVASGNFKILISLLVIKPKPSMTLRLTAKQNLTWAM